MEYIEQFLYWYGWQITEFGHFIMIQSDYFEMRDGYDLAEAILTVFVSLSTLWAAIEYLRTYKKAPSKISEVIDEEEIVYKTRIVYNYPPNKERKHCIFLAEYMGSKIYNIYAHDDSKRILYFEKSPFGPKQPHFIVEAHESRCKGVGGKTRLLVVNVQPFTPEP